MAKNRLELVNICKRKTKDSTATATSGYQEDLDIALGIVDSLLNTNEDTKTGTLSLTAGVETYALASDVETVEQVLITSPVGNKKELEWVDKNRFREVHPNTSNDGTSVPTVYYESESTINATTNVETKNISVYPIPSGSFTLTYSYKHAMPVMATDAAYPSFNGRYHHILADYAIWQYYEREVDESGSPMMWENKWTKDLQWLVETYPMFNKYPNQIPGPDQYEAD